MKRIIFALSLLLLASCARQATPMIGISCSRSNSGAAQLNTSYTEAVTKAGGVPVVLPTVGTPEEAAALLEKLDGIVFSGGEDVDPAMYGETIWNGTVYIDHVRDRSDSLLARAALASGKPILAICRGSQLMNVMLGGTLYQDIPSQLPEARRHSGATHTIAAEPGSVLAGLFGTDSLTVNSLHHQGVKDPAPGLRITARAADGMVEGYETDQVLAVQFHPEKLLQAGETRWIPFFETFVDRCR